MRSSSKGHTRSVYSSERVNKVSSPIKDITKRKLYVLLNNTHRKLEYDYSKLYKPVIKNLKYSVLPVDSHEAPISAENTIRLGSSKQTRKAYKGQTTMCLY